MPRNTPSVIRHCAKCNRKMGHYCSEKFRVNANQTRVDVWLIYKCTKCDSTLKLAIKKGIKPRDIPADLFDGFINNDKNLAWQYAFDRHFLKQHMCVVDYAGVEYSVEGAGEICNPAVIHLKSAYMFDLKLSALLARALGTSISQIKKLVDSGVISTSPACDIMKYRIRADLDVHFHEIVPPPTTMSPS